VTFIFCRIDIGFYANNVPLVDADRCLKVHLHPSRLHAVLKLSYDGFGKLLLTSSSCFDFSVCL
jgi:hypothetical protein